MSENKIYPTVYTDTDTDYIDPKWNTKSAHTASKIAGVVYDMLDGDVSKYHISASTYRDGTLIALHIEILDDSVPVAKIKALYDQILECMTIDDRMLGVCFDVETYTYVIDFHFQV